MIYKSTQQVHTRRGDREKGLPRRESARVNNHEKGQPRKGYREESDRERQYPQERVIMKRMSAPKDSLQDSLYENICERNVHFNSGLHTISHSTRVKMGDLTDCSTSVSRSVHINATSAASTLLYIYPASEKISFSWRHLKVLCLSGIPR